MEKANSDVVISFDPRFFTWHRGTNERRSRTEMWIRITDKGHIFLSKRAAIKISECTKQTEGGFYRVEIGVAQKAIALRPMPPNSEGYRFRVHDKYGTLRASCKEFVESLNLELPFSAPLIWDERHQMLVAKFPGADERPPMRRGRSR